MHLKYSGQVTRSKIINVKNLHDFRIMKLRLYVFDHKAMIILNLNSPANPVFQQRLYFQF